MLTNVYKLIIIFIPLILTSCNFIRPQSSEINDIDNLVASENSFENIYYSEARLKLFSEVESIHSAGEVLILKKNNKYSLVYPNGEILSTIFILNENIAIDNIHFSNEIGLISDSDNKLGYIDKNGKFLIEPKFKTASLFNKAGYATVVDEETNRYIIIDSRGRQVVDKTFAYLKQYNGMTDFFICNDYGDDDNQSYYILNDKLEVVLQGLGLYYRSDSSVARTIEVCIIGDDSSFLYVQDNRYKVFDIISQKTIADYATIDEFVSENKDFPVDPYIFCFPNLVGKDPEICAFEDEITHKYGAKDDAGNIIIDPVFDEIYPTKNDSPLCMLKNDEKLMYVFFDKNLTVLRIP